MGPDADQFSLASDDLPVTLQPGEPHTVTIQFTPTSAGEKSATIRAEMSGGSSRTVGQLAGTGVDETGDETAAGSPSDESDADDSVPDDSDGDEAPATSSTEETTGDESATDATDDSTSSNDASTTEGADGSAPDADTTEEEIAGTEAPGASPSEGETEDPC